MAPKSIKNRSNLLASQIEDFAILWPSKRPSKFHPFSHRFFIDLGSVLASILEGFVVPCGMIFYYHFLISF